MQLLTSTHRAQNSIARPRLAVVDHPSADARRSDSDISKSEFPFIRTKTQIPWSHGDIQRRERLENMSTEMQQKRLTLVTAPPGCGKSALARQWSEAAVRQGMRVAWFSIDADDNDPLRFMLYLHQAMVHSGLRDRTVQSNAIQCDPERSPSEISSVLINWVAEAGEELLVVFDNYSWITDANIHGQISYILANAPSNLHLVILASDLPPLPIGRLRAGNQLLELNSGAIRFTKAETLEQFRKNALMPIPYEQLEELYRFTQGWAAAVRIISLGMGKLGNSPTLVRGILDCRIFDAIDQYLDDLFVNFPEGLIEMMVDTSIVETLSLPLCLAISDDDNAETFFSQIRQQQILIPSHPELGRHTYPAPVRRYLHKKLFRKGNRHLAVLHRKAYAWYTENAQWDNAVDHALAVGDTEIAVAWMELHVMSILKSGRFGTLLKWRQRISALSVTVPLNVTLSFAWAQAVSQSPDAALDLLAEIAACPETLSPAVQAECHAIRAVALVLADRIEHAAEAVALCAKQHLTDRWTSNIVSNVELYCSLQNGQWTAFFSESSVLHDPAESEANNHVLRLTLLGIAALLRGQPAIAERYAVEALQLAPVTKDKDFFCFSAWPSGLLAALYYEQGRHDELETFLASRLESIAASGYLDCTLAAFIAAARTATIKGNLSEALATLEKAESIAIARKWPRLEAAVLLERICLFLEDNRQEEAEGCLQRLTQLSKETSNSHTSPICSTAQMHQIGKAHLAIHTGRADEAIAPLTALQHHFSKNGNELHAVRMGTLLSIANVKLNRATEAERSFRETMERAEKGGFVRSVLDQGRETSGLLFGLRASIADNEAYAWLRRHCERTLAARNDVSDPHLEHCESPPAKENTGSPLTPKERDVLALIARGQSNKEVARNLNVAPETIKTHLKNIFFKLSVDRRIQAVAKAQALGLVARESA